MNRLAAVLLAWLLPGCITLTPTQRGQLDDRRLFAHRVTRVDVVENKLYSDVRP